MPNYKKMYHTLLNKIADVIVDLQEVQRQTEEMYIDTEEQIVELILLENGKEDSISATLLK